MLFVGENPSIKVVVRENPTNMDDFREPIYDLGNLQMGLADGLDRCRVQDRGATLSPRSR